MHEGVPARDDLHLLPVSWNPLCGLDRSPRSQFTVPIRFWPARHELDQPPGDDDTAPLPFIELARVAVLGVEVELVAAHLPRVLKSLRGVRGCATALPGSRRHAGQDRRDAMPRPKGVIGGIGVPSGLAIEPLRGAMRRRLR